jgi:predicted GNAT family acetyltransferase
MEVRRLDDPRSFLEAARSFLMRDEARHNLVFGIVDTLIRHPSVYAAWHLWVAEDGADVVGAALQTPPHNLVLAQPASASVADALVDAIHVGGLSLPGVSGVVPEAIEFADRWVARAGGSTRTRMSQGVYTLRAVHDLPLARGSMRRATETDLDLITAWLAAFADEVETGVVHDPDQRRRLVLGRLTSGDHAGFWLWEDAGAVVSLTGFGVVTPNGARIGPVYTPPELRGHGYATSLTADVSSWLLAGGRSFCFLYTDLANPTSNAIYRRIGYEQVYEAIDLAFEP